MHTPFFQNFSRKRCDMTEYKIGCAIVRIHGSCDQDNLKAATEEFVKKVERKKKNEKKSIEKSA